MVALNKYALVWLPMLVLLVLPLTSGFAGQQPKQPKAFRDCSGCPEMIVIPSGSFMIGSPANDGDRSDDGGPRKEVHIRRFAVGKYDITRGQWAKFVAATKCDTGRGCAWTGVLKRMPIRKVRGAISASVKTIIIR